jgi:hypothetical protein
MGKETGIKKAPKNGALNRIYLGGLMIGVKQIL